MVRVPTHAPPTHPGEVLLEEFLKPLDMSQAELARRIKVSRRLINEIVKEKRSVQIDTARKFARFFRTSAELWMSLQLRWDLYHAERSAVPEVEAIEPVEYAHV